MAVSLEHFIALRPFLYHVTARANQAVLERDLALDSAADLMRRAGRPDLLRWRRQEPITLVLGTSEIVLKDPRPLIESNLALEGSSEIGDLVEYLNELVFFWPGRADGPISQGARLLGRYEARSPLVLRVATRELLECNAATEPLFCPFNSGAPRRQNGQRSRRGPFLFVTAERFSRNEVGVVEVAFRSRVVLPHSVQVRGETTWLPLRG